MRYLFKYGKYITDNEIKTAKFLSNYSEYKIDILTSRIVNAYLLGFSNNNKNISKKSTVGVYYNIGQERIIKKIIPKLKRHNLETLIYHIIGETINKQYDYDHRFDIALYFDEEFTKSKERNYKFACEECKNIFSEYAGTIGFDRFGDIPFIPENKKQHIKLNEKQLKLMNIHKNNLRAILNEYVLREEISFTVLSFPIPEIGNNFEQIFDDILEINMQDGEKYEIIQQKIIDILDAADYVHVKGKNNNLTNIKIKMQELKNSSQETNFRNFGAEVNMPAGEIYTTPKLKGTNGILHIGEIFLKGLKYINLKFYFQDGFTTSFSCTNFNNNGENKKYIEENLLFPHKSLPLGEFAIGTNTLLYVMAKKYDIINIFPIFLIEKMGPHLAIGDTCFSRQEDKPSFNRLDGKEITAKENEKTALRKTNINDAYTNCHTDITLPYNEIEFISAIMSDGKKIDIIKNGRFVLIGTEKLNEPFDK